MKNKLINISVLFGILIFLLLFFSKILNVFDNIYNNLFLIIYLFGMFGSTICLSIISLFHRINFDILLNDDIDSESDHAGFLFIISTLSIMWPIIVLIISLFYFIEFIEYLKK